MSEYPKQYLELKKRSTKLSKAAENSGKAARESGPLSDKIANLIKLAAAVAIRSEGAVHSHVSRALDSGAKPEEIYYAIILLTSTTGFPAVPAAISWADDIIDALKK